MQTNTSWRRFSLLLATLLLPVAADAQSALRIIDARTLQPEHLEFLLELPPDTGTVEPGEVQLLEDAQPTARASALAAFRRSDWTLALVLAIDTSGSVKQYLTPVSLALPKFVATLPQSDALALITFDDRVHADTPSGTPREQVQAQLERLSASGNRTLLYGALKQSLDAAESRLDRTRRRVLIISDGADESSDQPDAADALIKRAAELRVALDTIWVGRPAASTRNTLVRLAEQTGGIHRDAINPARVADDVGAALTEILATVERSVVVSFDREVQASGTTDEIGVSLARPGVAPATMALQVARSAVPEPPIDRSSEAIRWIVRGLASLIAVYALYVALYLAVKNWAPEWLAFFPFNPLPFRKKIADSTDKTPAPPGPPPKQRRQTMVANPAPPLSSRDGGHGLALQAVDGPLKGQRVAIVGPRFQIGAGNDNDLRITADKYLSSMHARFEDSKGQWMLFDQGSSNGTFVDGRRLSAGQGVALRDGQRIRIGGSEFQVLFAEPAVVPAKPATPPPSEPVR